MRSLSILTLSALLIVLSPLKIFSVEKGTTKESASCLPQYRFDGQKLVLSEEEWKKRLTPEQYKILREGGTETAFQNAYFNNKEKGIYYCAGCNLPLYSSDAKYEAGTGWPSFWQPICKDNVTIKDAWHWFSIRTEVVCSRCEGHLGDVFNDGPPPTGKRYCMDSAALKFVPKGP